MSEGRWSEDIFGDTPPAGNAGPRLLRYLKWTWLPALIAVGPMTMWFGDYGWVIVVAVWFATTWFPYHLDNLHRHYQEEAWKRAQERDE